MNAHARPLLALLTTAGMAAPAFAQCPPSSPQSLSASKGTACSAVILDWLDVSGATSYRIYRNTANSYANSNLVGTSFTSNFNDITALPETNYYYWVVAVRGLCLPANSTSNPAGPATGYTRSSPYAPDNVSASDGTECGGILVHWTPQTGLGSSPSSFTVYRNTINLYLTSSSVGTTGGSATQFFDDTALPGATYYYWVRAENLCGTAASSGDSGTVNPNPPPINNTCLTAANIIAGQSYAGSTSCAGANGPSTCTASATSPDVWYRFVGAQSGTLHLSTCGISGSFDTVLAAFLGPCGLSPGPIIACNDNGCPSGTLSKLDIPVVPGTEYFIRVAGAAGASGNFTLSTSFTPAPGACYANCDGSTTSPVLNVSDFGCFLSKFASGDPYANCDGSTSTPALNVADFGCYLTKFAAGCS